MAQDYLKFTMLGCGSSPGTPRINGDWGACDPNEPKNTRLRCSLLVERISDNGRTSVVVDTSPDFRQQMLNSAVGHVDAVLYTHAHADHIHGIDDLRGYALAQRSRIDVYADAPTLQRLTQGFGYCFETPEGSMYPPILNAHLVEAGKSLKITGAGGAIDILPVKQIHGDIFSTGYRFNEPGGKALCYSPDISGIPDESVAAVSGLTCWIVDALQYKPHVSHFSVSQALEWIERLEPELAILTHMHIPLDYNKLKSELPETVEPGFDGKTVKIEIKQ